MKPKIGFTLILVFFYAICAIGPGFFALILQQKGVPSPTIGAFTALVALTATLAQPIYGYFCDKTCKAKQMLVGAGALAIASYCALILVNGLVPLLICSFLIGATLNATYGFTESWMSKLGCDKMGINFGVVRSFGSLSYAATAALYGFVFDRFGMASMPLCMLVCFLCMSIFAWKCPNPEPALSASGEKEKIAFSAAFRVLLQNKRYVLVVCCFTLASLPTGAVIGYYAVHLKALGGTGASVGLAMACIAGSEFFVMQGYKWLERKFGNTALLGFCFIMYAVKNLAIGLAPTVTLAVLAGLTQAFCYGLAVPATQSFVAKNITEKYAATAQLVCNAGGMMLAQLPGALLGGFLVQFLSPGAMIAWMSVFSFVAFTVFVVGLRFTKEKCASMADA